MKDWQLAAIVAAIALLIILVAMVRGARRRKRARQMPTDSNLQVYLRQQLKPYREDLKRWVPPDKRKKN